MDVRVLIMGYDLNEHQLITDILEITFPNTVVDRTVNIETFFTKLEESTDYNLIVLDLSGDRQSNQDFLDKIRARYPQLLERIVILLEQSEVKIDESLIGSISFLNKPFSLDTFGEIIQKVVKK
ncbi:MAG: response regulator transcription factor [Chitinivibrionales bacterium]|nr:response regulator transcription factor [Chitinivibrionales bacterium]